MGYKKSHFKGRNETQTRDYLIECFEILGYDKYDFNHEYSLQIDTGKVQKVDMAINVRNNRKSPDILIECKKATQNLTENNYNQLADTISFIKNQNWNTYQWNNL